MKTKTIIDRLIVDGKQVFGYVDLGVTIQNLTDTKSGEAGTFCDDAGFDYGVTRNRQAHMIEYCHSKGMNVWIADDIFPGTNVQINSNDIYSLESYLISDAAYNSLNNCKSKARKQFDYFQATGITHMVQPVTMNPSSNYRTFIRNQ
ncbi:hypothetical protein I4U23_030185 [Adineta vaga]|nr:hypothetical protein I4U23_030185 [Adineta vaga]